MELPHGGWVAKNIYYMGFASVINFGGLRIGGWSGIFKQNDYSKSKYLNLFFIKIPF
jgi:lariat debranching enzyme